MIYINYYRYSQSLTIIKNVYGYVTSTYIYENHPNLTFKRIYCKTFKILEFDIENVVSSFLFSAKKLFITS